MDNCSIQTGDLLFSYTLFNRISASKFRHKFPYDALSENKIIFTKNKIDLLIRKPSLTKRGGGKKTITIYH